MMSILVSRMVGVFALCFFLAARGQAQIKQRVAVFPFDDRTTANKDMNIGVKLADLLIAKLAENHDLTVFDRQYVDKLLAEKNLKYDPNFDSTQAAKQGLMGTVDVVIAGQIVAFNANTTQKTVNKIYAKSVETDGVVALKATVRMISVERGSIIAAPSAEKEQTVVLGKSNVYLADSKTGQGAGSQQSAGSKDEALRRLVDQAADEVASQLSSDVVKSAISLPPPVTIVAVATKPDMPVAKSDIKAAFVGVSDGMAYIDKGTAAGIIAGEKFKIRRVIKTALTGPDGKPILRHKEVCTLTVTELEETSAAGKCLATAPGLEGTPKSGDEVLPFIN